MDARAWSRNLDGRLIWRALRARLRDEKAELRAAHRNIAASDIVCDIGANKGSYLFWLSRWAGRVVAFEPQIDLANYLKRSFGTGSNVQIEVKGVSASSGHLNFYIPYPGSPGASLVKSDGDATTIPVIALDDYFKPEQRVAFLKIDVEGAELDVFRGAARILRDSKPVLLFECEARHCLHGVGEVFEHLIHAGYAGSFFYRGETRPLAEFDSKIHQALSDGRYWDHPDYCNNFLFVPNGMK